jgi:hypothetical protein
VWAESYIRTLLDRDIRDLANIESSRHFPQIFRFLAAHNGAQINNNGMSRDLEIPASTLKRYVDLLSKLFLIQHVPAHTGNRGAKTMKSPKAYLVDSLLVAYSLNLSANAIRQDRNLFGPILEGFVANELARLITASDSRATLSHLRTVRNKEVDFVLETGEGDVVGIEVKASRSPNPSDFNGLHFLSDLIGERFKRGILLYAGTTVIPQTPKIVGLPISALWNLQPLKPR